MSASYFGLEITAADHGGYLVRPTGGDPGAYRGLLFAGELDECLEFIRRVVFRAEQQAPAPEPKTPVGMSEANAPKDPE